ncbi:hypothetical protein, partial [Kocuria marina]|uniref:hypothetical protein n=1 Tax=Kocuria marina TaxID=223184 RepID=UPI003460EBA6
VVGWWERPTQEDRAAPTTPPRIVRSEAEDDSRVDTTNLTSLAALAIACVAFLVAVADWLQLGREAPWEATWGEDGILVLTRRHYWPVWIESFLNFHGGGVSVVNDAAAPVSLMSRNSTVVLRIGPGGRGTALNVFYRRATIWELLKKRLGRLHHNPHWSFTAMSTDHLNWSTPVLFSGLQEQALEEWYREETDGDRGNI